MRTLPAKPYEWMMQIAEAWTYNAMGMRQKI